MNGILTRFNWFALAGSVAIILVIAVSLVSPWWQLTIGDDLMTVNASPVNMNMGSLDVSFIPPLFLALNIVSVLSLLASAIALLIYSLMPRKSYSMHLLGFGYKKPLFTVLFFVVGLVLTTVICQTFLSFTIPLMGSTISTVVIPFVTDITLTVPLSAAFHWSFLLAIVAAGLCIVARLYHGKVASVKKV